MDIDGAISDFGRTAPDAVEKLRTRKHAAGLFEHIFEQANISRGETDIARAAAHALRCAVENDVADRQDFSHAFGPAAPQQRTDAGHQLRALRKA